MPKLVKDGAIVDNEWTLMPKPENAPEAAEVPPGQVIVPLSVWRAQREALGARSGRGDWLNSDEAPEAVQDAGAELALHAQHFPLFSDGRPLSSARLVLRRYGV